ncbi:MAG: serine hydrolase [Cyclobacteriaceae bacterium]|nr:serine hydrolase [Cyclobacteriaceae bacterium]
MKNVIIFLMLLEQTFILAQSINSENLNKLIDYCNESKADEIILSSKSEMIAHWKRTDYTNLLIDQSLSKCNTPYMGTASMVKSWTGLLVGILIDKHYVRSVDDYVCEYLPDWKIGCQNKITIKHLLTMTGGFTRLGGRGILSQTDMNKYALNLKPDTIPGIRFSYSNESVQILGILAERVTKLKGDELFTRFIFKPMEMDSTSFSKDSVGNIIFYGGCTTTVKNASKIGQLMLNIGQWNGVQIVSEQWVKESTTPGDLAPYYGYLWWIDRNSKFWNYAATGDLGQMTIIFPELDLVFIRKQSCDLSPASKNMSWMGPKFLGFISSVVDK